MLDQEEPLPVGCHLFTCKVNMLLGIQEVGLETSPEGGVLSLHRLYLSLS